VICRAFGAKPAKRLAFWKCGRESLVVAIADFMDDDVNGEGARAEQQQRDQSTPARRSESQQPRIKSITKKSSSSSYCAPYDTLYWLGGDCMRGAVATSLEPITECTTMKIDNTTEEMIKPPALVSPSKSSMSSTTNSTEKEDNIAVVKEDQNSKNTNDSISSNEMDDAANGDLISQFRQQYPTEGETGNRRSNSKPLFKDDAAYIEVDYTDPLNSILVEDHTDATKNYRDSYNSSGEKNENKIKVHSDFFLKYNQKMNNSNKINNSSTIFCGNTAYTASETEEEDWISSTSSVSSWCGGYTPFQMLTYGVESPKEHKRKEKYPDYYADFKPQRQYAFDEEDGSYSEGSPNPSRALVDSSTDDRATPKDGNSVLTSQSSVNSFMIINRPHLNTTMPVTPLTKKLERNSQRLPPKHGRQDHHLHKLISSPPPGILSRLESLDPSNTDSETYTNFDYALTQSLMRKMQKFFPYGKRGDSFWLQYSMIRDGASLDSLLDMVHRDSNDTRNNIHSVLAIETVEGELFGAFLTNTWRRSNRQWYGGGQSFLWTTCPEASASTDDNEGSASKDKELRVFPYSFDNNYVQLCDRDRLLVGGGDGGDNYERYCYGFGIALEADLLSGTSCPCTTFQSPSLSKIHSDGSTFEIRNLEVWTLTPCLSVIDNPSQGLVRVHKRDSPKKSKKEKSSGVEKAHSFDDGGDAVARSRNVRRHKNRAKSFGDLGPVASM